MRGLPLPLKVLIVPDKFKGTLTATTAAEAIARGWRKARPHDALELAPMSDGGDGFGEVISRLLSAGPQATKTLDAARRPCSARWWWEPKTKTAIIESAKVIGLAMLPPAKFHPFDLDTFGLGGVIQSALAKGAKHCLMGIGGSATNDGGFGLARAIGWQFLDAGKNPIDRWIDLRSLAFVRRPEKPHLLKSVTVAVDVQNRLLGLRGATRIFGPQKGLRAEDFARAERCLQQLARVMAKELSHDFAKVPGAGAAGGLGFGLLAFLGARLEPGFQLFAQRAAFEQRLRAADVVVTGEGAIDLSTLMGKGVGQLARRCRELRIPCHGLAGVVDASAKLKRLFASVHALTDLTGATRAKANAAFWLEKLATRAAAQLPEDKASV